MSSVDEQGNQCEYVSGGQGETSGARVEVTRRTLLRGEGHVEQHLRREHEHIGLHAVTRHAVLCENCKQRVSVVFGVL